MSTLTESSQISLNRGTAGNGFNAAASKMLKNYAAAVPGLMWPTAGGFVDPYSQLAAAANSMIQHQTLSSTDLNDKMMSNGGISPTNTNLLSTTMANTVTAMDCSKSLSSGFQTAAASSNPYSPLVSSSTGASSAAAAVAAAAAATNFQCGGNESAAATTVGKFQISSAFPVGSASHGMSFAKNSPLSSAAGSFAFAAAAAAAVAHSTTPNTPKKKPQPVPDHLKDEAYRERRRRNNESARKSRENRRSKDEQITFKVVYLEQENHKLQAQVYMLQQELDKLRFLLYNNTNGQA